MPIDAHPTALERLIREGSDEDLRRFLLLLQPPEIADIIEVLEQRGGPGARLPRDRRARSSRTSCATWRRARSARSCSRASIPTETARLVTDMQSDDAADLLHGPRRGATGGGSQARPAGGSRRARPSDGVLRRERGRHHADRTREGARSTRPFARRSRRSGARATRSASCTRSSWWTRTAGSRAG